MKKPFAALCLFLTLCLALCAPALAFDTSKDSGLVALVNKTHTLPADYVPALQDLSGSVPMNTSASSMRPEAAQACIAMYRAMKADGVPVCLGQSGYRSYSTQRYLVSTRTSQRVGWGMSPQDAYNSATWYTAPAGASEHQTGLAMDFNAGAGLVQSFACSPAGKWLQEHAWEYGFILRYQADKTAYTMIGAEAWHYRYLGLPHAKLMKERGWCLEEYIDYLHQNGSISTEADGVRYEIFWTADPSREFSDIQDISGDNAGGWIVTTARPLDPYRLIRGHRSEAAFRRLEELGVKPRREINPEAAISGQELARLCGIEGGLGYDVTREEAVLLLFPYLGSARPAPLLYQDADRISPQARPAVEAAASRGLVSNATGEFFYPKGLLSWADAAGLALRFRTLSGGNP